jgi:alanyl-tRNA synthetase
MLGSFKVFIDEVKKHEKMFHVVLKENVIRPAGGGQAGDRGRLRVGDQEVAIIDTVMDSGKITLVADGHIPEQSEGNLDIDLDWRLAMMRNHTSEHLFVALMKKKFPDLEIGELWIDGIHGSIELIGVNASFDDIFDAEKMVQEIVEHSVTVQSEFVDAGKIDSSTRAREGLTSKHDNLRIVKVGDLDSSACSGIHVETTDLIGFFKVIDVKYDGDSTRIEFVSEEGAVVKTRDLYNTVLRRKLTYPFEMEQVGAVLDWAKIAIEDKTSLIERIGKLISSGMSLENIGGVVYRYEYLPGFRSKDLKNLANRFTFDESSVVLLFAPGPKSQVILRTFNTDYDASHYISEAVKEHGGRGGGSKENFTGGFTDITDPEKLFDALVSAVREVLSQ